MFNLGYRLFRAIEKTKVALSSQTTAALDFEEERIAIHTTVTRAEFDTYSQPLIDELERCTDELMARAPEAKIDAVFLTGGSSQIPAVQALYARKFGADRLRTGDAFTSVVEGLGRAGVGDFGDFAK